MKAPQQDVIVGPYPTTVKEQRVDHCSGPDFVFNTLAPCPVPLMTVSQPGEWCGPVTTSPTSPTTGGMWICTVYENLGVNLTGIVAGWDLASAPPGGGAPPWGAMPSSIPGSPGFVGPPDGNIDQWDHFAGGTLGGMAWTNVPDPGSLPLLESYSTIVYPPATMPYGFGQIQVFPLVGPNLLPIPLPVGGPIGVGCI
jgi:hypothetical protein